MRIPISINNHSITLTEERWRLLREAHPEIARLRQEINDAIEDPDTVLAGPLKNLIAVKKIEGELNLVVLYSEKGENDGMIVTAYITRDLTQFDDLRTLWNRNI